MAIFVEKCDTNDHSIQLVAFLETKLGSVDNRIIRGLGGVVLTRGVGVDADGSAGGLLSLLSEELVSIKDCISNRLCIILVGVIIKLNQEVVLCNVYAPNSENERRELCGFILNVQQSFPLPWCLRADFNTVLNAAERNGGEFNKWSARAFNNFILQAKTKLRAARGIINKWAMAKVKDQDTTKELEEKLAKIDERAGSNKWTDTLSYERLEAIFDIWKAIRREE
ncbi:hypothetical protein Dsin_012278 [Dipteronia sinensis]|uniref:Uncharacterized protein n=1 Tax=Dipteronia sinensis TaxID=43782 RepID=A0AAE0AHP4_9ROSI|nr:hypothetical protein Dsin_012278 [Dipteronia sinensis]